MSDRSRVTPAMEAKALQGCLESLAVIAHDQRAIDRVLRHVRDVYPPSGSAPGRLLAATRYLMRCTYLLNKADRTTRCSNPANHDGPHRIGALAPGCWPEVWSLTFGRSRLVVTDGYTVSEFW